MNLAGMGEKRHSRQRGKPTTGKEVGERGNVWWVVCWSASGAQGEPWDSCPALPSPDYCGRWWGPLEALRPLGLQPRFQLCPSSTWRENAQNLNSPNNRLDLCEPNCHLPCCEFVLIVPQVGTASRLPHLLELPVKSEQVRTCPLCPWELGGWEEQEVGGETWLWWEQLRS